MAKRVALVDDEAVARQYIEQMPLFKEMEFELCFSAPSGQALLDYLAKEPVDIVLMDVSMPGMNGITLSALISKKYPKMQMIAISNYDNYDNVREMMRNGACDYLLKPRLTGETLAFALRGAGDSVMNADESELLLKERVREAITASGAGDISPFPNDGARLAIIIYRMNLQAEAQLRRREMVLSGIESILEKAAKENERCTVLFQPPGRFVAFIRFYDENSTAAIQRRLHHIAKENVSSIWEIYHLQMQTDILLPMLDNRAILSYLAHRLEGNEQVKQNARITLSVAEQKALLYAIDSRSEVAVRAQIERLITGAAEQGELALGVITAELADILAQVAQKENIALPQSLQAGLLFNQPWEALQRLLVAAAEDVLRAMAVKSGNSGLSPAVEKAMAFMRAGHDKPIGLVEVAEHVGVTASYLSRTFHRECRQTLIDYLTNLRVEAAKALLAQGVPLKEVPALVGFSQYPYFIKVFKQRTGVTPKQYLVEIRPKGQNSATP